MKLGVFKDRRSFDQLVAVVVYDFSHRALADNARNIVQRFHAKGFLLGRIQEELQDLIRA
jgi:superfamily II DNA or RNA helicase